MGPDGPRMVNIGKHVPMGLTKTVTIIMGSVCITPSEVLLLCGVLINKYSKLDLVSVCCNWVLVQIRDSTIWPKMDPAHNAPAQNRF